MSSFAVWFAAAALVFFGFGQAFADLGDCGQPYSGGGAPATSDSLYVLKAAVGTKPCELCQCDLNGSGTITSPDALLDLKLVVGQPVVLDCPSCVTTTTTTTLGGECPAPGVLHNRTFNEIYTCIQKFTGQPYFCADQNEGDAIKFTYLGNGDYEIRDVPDTGFIYNGTLNCRTFDWTASDPGEYNESGIWTFSSDMESFSGSSTYFAVNGGYQGSCLETGAESPATPPNPPVLPPCN